MRRSAWSAFGAAAMAATIAGCSGGSAQLTPRAGYDTTYGRAAATAGAGRSWMAKDAASENLLYVSDLVSGNVYVYSYPWGKLVGTITNNQGPQSICADNSGHVWIVNILASQIVEYDHGGTTPVARLKDPGFSPYNCAVDPTTGNLAVANAFSASGAPGPTSLGNVVIYRKARGKPHTFTTSAIQNYYYLTYDDSGNLFVDGYASDGATFELAGMPAGASSLTSITLDQSFFPDSLADVKWDGKYVAVADSNTKAIYEFKIRGSRGRKVGTTMLSDASSGSFALAQICFPRVHRQDVQATRVIVPNSSAVGFWGYPAGGNVKHFVTESLIFAVGIAVSKAP